MNRQTTLAKNIDAPEKWWVVDATDMVLGRLSSRIATVLMGKHKATYTPNTLTGDAVIVLNADKVRLTGRKAEQKTFQTYVFYPDGQKSFSYKWMLDHRPELLFERAVRRMLPKNKLASRMLKNLKIFRGGEHPHQAQQPQPLKVA